MIEAGQERSYVRMIRASKSSRNCFAMFLVGMFADVQTLPQAKKLPVFEELPLAGPHVVGVAFRVAAAEPHISGRQVSKPLPV